MHPNDSRSHAVGRWGGLWGLVLWDQTTELQAPVTLDEKGRNEIKTKQKIC